MIFLRWLEDLISLYRYTFELCTDCGEELEYKCEVIERLDGLVCEQRMKCNKCNSLQDYFAYGAHERDFWRHECELRHPGWSVVFFILRRFYGRFRRSVQANQN